MRQVPAFTSYLVIGGGRLSRHLQQYLKLESLPFETWNRSLSFEELELRVSRASHVLLAISDGAIESFSREHAQSGGKWVHFSGALSLPDVPGAHPLMTFTEAVYEDVERYRGIPFITEKGRESFADLLPGLANPSFAIDSELKPLYHALCVLSGNFTVLLWEKAFTEFGKKLGLPKEVIVPYLRQIAENLERTAPSESVLTGPLKRGDQETIEKNLEALANDPYSGVYRAFVKAYGESR